MEYKPGRGAIPRISRFKHRKDRLMVNYRKLKDMDCKLSKRILNKHPLGFISAIVTGERGWGKSMYTYKAMAKVYWELNGYTKTDDEVTAYDMALEHMLFNMEGLAKLINKNVINDLVTPVICLDDATVNFCSYKFFTDRAKVIHIHSVFDTIRIACTGLLLTCPKRKMLLPFLRNYDSLRIQIKMRDDKWRRYARAYRWVWLPDDKKFNINIPFQDNFSCYVPDEFYENYKGKRTAILKDANKEMMKVFGLKDATT